MNFKMQYLLSKFSIKTEPGAKTFPILDIPESRFCHYAHTNQKMDFRYKSYISIFFSTKASNNF